MLHGFSVNPIFRKNSVAEIMSQFSTSCFRDFKRFIGELTATAAGIHSSVQHTAECIKAMESQDPWADIAHKYNIKVNGLVSDHVLKSTSRLAIVSIYSGFDLFLSSFRKQYYKLSGQEWTAEKSDTPFDEFYRNINRSSKKLKVNESEQDVIDYYRLSRNAIVHPSDENIKAAKKFYCSKIGSIKSVRSSYSMQRAPNKFDDLDFHDVKLLSRLLLDVLPSIDMAIDPGDERLREHIPFSKWARFEEARRKNAAIGYLKHNFGVSSERAERIYNSNGSLA